ncbi:Uncharacterised protein [Niallia circulans]|jgi:hypothetical protein|nr:Uncharacterised protein [Niallia circulans]
MPLTLALKRINTHSVPINLSHIKAKGKGSIHL